MGMCVLTDSVGLQSLHYDGKNEKEKEESPLEVLGEAIHCIMDYP